MLYQRCEAIIRAWPQWSPAERRHMDALVAEIMRYVIDGDGNAFVRAWVARNLAHLMPA